MSLSLERDLSPSSSGLQLSPSSTQSPGGDQPAASPQGLLQARCSVCGDAAATHLHYGAVSCYSCRAFFRRGKPRQNRCIKGTNNCEVLPKNRKSCKVCRYRKCLESGMQPEKVDAGWAKRPGSVQTPVESPVRSSAESGPRQRTPKKNERKTNPVVVKNEEECNPSLRLDFSAPDEELSERDIIMINRGMAIRRTSDTYGAFPPLDVPSPPCQPYPGHPGQWSPYHHNQSQRYLGYAGPYLGYGPTRQPPGQPYTVLVKQERPLEYEIACPPVTSVIQSRISPQYSPPSILSRPPFSPPGQRTSPSWPAPSQLSKSEEEEEKERGEEIYTSPQKSSFVIPNENNDAPVDLESGCRIESVIKIVRKNSNKELDESEESFNEKKEEEQHDTEDYPDGIDKLTYPEEDNEIDDIIQRTDLDLLTNVDDDNESEEDIGESSLQPLKKRRRMMEVPYPIGHAFNKSFTSVNFTLEEEFRIIDYLVRIQKYQNGRFDFLFFSFPHYDDLTVRFITCTMNGNKIPFNASVEQRLFQMGLEFTKRDTKHIFQELNILSSSVRGEVLNFTYPALLVVFFSILEGNTKESTWLAQHAKTLQITKENHDRLKEKIKPLVGVRSISIKDQERFTSPWAKEWEDEQKFEKILSQLGRILRDDKKLQAIYHMLVMMTPPPSSSERTRRDPLLLSIQKDLQLLLYRYLCFQDETKIDPGTNKELAVSLMGLSEDMTCQSPSAVASTLIDLVDQVHDCADIMQHRSLNL